MPGSTEALHAILRELTVTYGLRLDPAASDEVRRVFDRTVGRFALEAADRELPGHPWENDEFRGFILGQVRRIAEAAAARAGGAPVTAPVFRQAAVDVMRRTNQVCRLAAERGRLKFAVAPAAEDADPSRQYEGQICAPFLDDPEPEP